MFGPENVQKTEDEINIEVQADSHEWLQVLRERYPNPESAARDYHQGHWTLGELQQIFNEDEINRMLAECKKLEANGE